MKRAWVTDDDKVFYSEREAREHEEELKREAEKKTLCF